MLAIDRYISNLVESKRVDSRVGNLATELAYKSNDHLIADSKSPNALAAAYLYFSAILLGVDLPLSSIAGITEFQIRGRCRDLLKSFKIIIRVKPLMHRHQHDNY
jgi:transcription initiation factor TFIIB